MDGAQRDVEELRDLQIGSTERCQQRGLGGILRLVRGRAPAHAVPVKRECVIELPVLDAPQSHRLDVDPQRSGDLVLVLACSSHQVDDAAEAFLVLTWR